MSEPKGFEIAARVEPAENFAPITEGELELLEAEWSDLLTRMLALESDD